MKKKLLKVIAGAPDRPLIIGNIKIPCYVLDDETRVLSQRGVYMGINRPRGGQKSIGDEMPPFVSQNWIKPFISKQLALAMKSPILFSIPNGPKAYGYPATCLVDICNAIIEADKNGATTPRQTSLVQRALSLMR